MKGMSSHVGSGASNSQGPASNDNWELSQFPQQDAFITGQ